MKQLTARLFADAEPSEYLTKHIFDIDASNNPAQRVCCKSQLFRLQFSAEIGT